MSSKTSNKGSILLTGGTGKISCRIAPLLSSHGYNTLTASRSGTTPSISHCTGVKFDWLDPSTYNASFEHGPISVIFLVAPPIMDCLPPMKEFIDLAITKGVKRLVLLSASLLEAGDGPMMGSVAKYIIELGVEYAVLRPTWFMENFSEMQHLHTIREKDIIVTAAGDGRLPFVSADNIAAVAFRALTDEKAHDTDHLILGSELWSYDDVAHLLTQKLGRRITHVKITEKELADGMAAFMSREYAELLASLDTAIKKGAEDRVNQVVEDVTGKKPLMLEGYIDRCVQQGVWEKI